MKVNERQDKMKQTHSNLWLTVLTLEQHLRTCDYWYCVTESHMAHTAFKTERGLRRWLEERGLKLSEPLTPPGTWSSQKIEGKYHTNSHFGYEDFKDFHKLADVVCETRTLSNGDYVVAKITEGRDGRTVHTLNPNEPRHEFDYAESREMMS